MGLKLVCASEATFKAILSSRLGKADPALRANFYHFHADLGLTKCYRRLRWKLSRI